MTYIFVHTFIDIFLTFNSLDKGTVNAKKILKETSERCFITICLKFKIVKVKEENMQVLLPRIELGTFSV